MSGAGLRLSWAQINDIGMRDENEDQVGMAQEGRMACFVVADGAGGHAGGAVASRLVADARVARARRANPALSEMSSTVAACTGTKFAMPTLPSSTPAASVPVAKAAAPSATPAPAPVAPPTSMSALAEGLALYDKGDYNNAIKRLALASGPGAPRATQLKALKFTAFSYCLTARPTLCRQQFEKAFRIDPAFDLDPGEKGHPLWGPVFLKAKKGKA